MADHDPESAAAQDEHTLATPPLRQPAPSPASEAAIPIGEGPGTRIGACKLLQQIGAGGFGVAGEAGCAEVGPSRVQSS